jgi:hypothetical protein
VTYRKLGKTNIEISEIGLGTEHLEKQSGDTINSVIRTAVDNGVNFIDLVLVSQEARDKVCAALRGIRRKVLLAAHFGQTYHDGRGIRDPDLCEASFYDLLSGLRTDCIDVLMFHNVNKELDYEEAFDRQGYLGLALRLKQEGKVRVLAISTHVTSIGMKAIQSGLVDAMMFPINPAHDLLPGDMSWWKKDTYTARSDCVPKPSEERKQLYLTCQESNIGLIAMKPYAGGLLLHGGHPSDYVVKSRLQEGSPGGILLNPVQCLSYILSQPGVSTVVPGCRKPEEVKAALAYVKTSEEERDFSGIEVNPLWKLRRRCVYCDHCLPCPVDIEIGTLMKLLDAAEHRLNKAVATGYGALTKNASDCTRCSVCIERCPFDVPIIERMERAVKVFGQ